MSNSKNQSQPPKAEVNQIIGLYNQGRLKQTVSLTENLAKQYPNALILYDILGAAYMGLKNTAKTIASYQKALQLNPNHTDAYNNMGMALYEKGRFDEAVDSYQKAVEIEPSFADAHYNLGNALKQTGELKQAIESYRVSLTINPKDAEVLLNYGNALKSYGDFEQAIKIYAQALKIDPNSAAARTNMENAYEEKTEIDTDAATYARSAELEIGSAEMISFTGTLLKARGYLDAAMDSYSQAIKIKPDCAEAHSNMGICLLDKGELNAAIDSCKQALEIKPDYALGHLNLSFILLNSGRLKEGLDEYEWRWKNDDFLSKKRHFSQPLWDGITSLKGQRILLWGEQGPQDMIIWSSCLPYLNFQAGHCIIECPEKLVPLFARSFPNAEFKSEDRNLDKQREDFDFHLPMGSLFRHFIPEISKKIKPDAFLIPDPVRVNFWKERLNSLGKGPFVGISWKSPIVTRNRQQNYTQTSDWAPVITRPNITFVNLQSSDFGEDIAAIQNEFGITVHHFDDLDHYNNLDDVTALCAALDIVVSVSTAVSAIAAGVGTSTKLVAWRQSSWNNILLAPRGPFVDAFERNTWEPWDEVFNAIAQDITKYQETGCST